MDEETDSSSNLRHDSAPNATVVDSNPSFNRNSFRSTFRLPPNRVTQASADGDIALADAAAAAANAVEASIVATDSTTCDSGLEQSPAADAELLTTSPRSSASPRLAEDDSFNQAASEFERQSVLLPSADLHLQFAGGSSTVARQQQPGADRPLPTEPPAGTAAVNGCEEKQHLPAVEDGNCDPEALEEAASASAGDCEAEQERAEVPGGCEEPPAEEAGIGTERPAPSEVQQDPPQQQQESVLEEPSSRKDQAASGLCAFVRSCSILFQLLASGAEDDSMLPASSSTSATSQQQQLRKQESRIRSLTAENARLQSELDSCRLVFREFDRCLRLVADKRHDADAQVVELMRDRDQALEDLQSVEKAFSDLHKRFEKSKQVIESLRANEQALHRSVQEHQARMKRNEQKYLTLKAHAEEKLEAANRHIDEQRRNSESELARLQAVLRKAELQAQNLQAQLDHKVQENAELTSICDELINRVGDEKS
uniref:TACC_C domain-containing protein n=1 Tax=Macrostomum lignano TaxID=282301 RepID=A0A1I8GFZ7_9PLAT